MNLILCRLGLIHLILGSYVHVFSKVRACDVLCACFNCVLLSDRKIYTKKECGWIHSSRRLLLPITNGNFNMTQFKNLCLWSEDIWICVNLLLKLLIGSLAATFLLSLAWFCRADRQIRGDENPGISSTITHFASAPIKSFSLVFILLGSGSQCPSRTFWENMSENNNFCYSVC